MSTLFPFLFWFEQNASSSDILHVPFLRIKSTLNRLEARRMRAKQAAPWTSNESGFTIIPLQTTLISLSLLTGHTHRLICIVHHTIGQYHASVRLYRWVVRMLLHQLCNNIPIDKTSFVCMPCFDSDEDDSTSSVLIAITSISPSSMWSDIARDHYSVDSLPCHY